jgi:hypothetical protein
LRKNNFLCRQKQLVELKLITCASELRCGDWAMMTVFFLP